jgi:hypothetical protein
MDASDLCRRQEEDYNTNLRKSQRQIMALKLKDERWNCRLFTAGP